KGEKVKKGCGPFIYNFFTFSLFHFFPFVLYAKTRRIESGIQSSKCEETAPAPAARSSSAETVFGTPNARRSAFRAATIPGGESSITRHSPWVIGRRPCDVRKASICLNPVL